MKAKILLIPRFLALAACLAFFCSCEDDDEPLGSGHDFGENNPDLITAVGDSMTESGWPQILAGMQGRAVVNRGHGGDTSGDGVSAARRALSADKPGFLLIQYGVNDEIHGFSPDWTVANLADIIRAAKANKTIPVVATMTPTYDNYRAFSGSVRKVNPLIRSMAKQEGATVADLERAFGDDRSLIKPDGLHLLPAGKVKVAQVFNAILD